MSKFRIVRYHERSPHGMSRRGVTKLETEFDVDNVTQNEMKTVFGKDNYFAIIPEWVLYSGVSPHAIKLYCVLARYADKDTGNCFPSRSTIADKADFSERTISKATAELVLIGALMVKRRFSEDGGYMSNLYTVITAKPLMQTSTLPPTGESAPTPSAEMPLPTSKSAHIPTGKTAPLTRVIYNESQINESQITREPNPEYLILAEYLAERIKDNGSRAPNVSQKWIDDIRLMVERDSRTPEQIRYLIDWCQNDGFWKTNILSPSKLREKFEQLRLNAQREHKLKEPRAFDALRSAHSKLKEDE